MAAHVTRLGDLQSPDFFPLKRVALYSWIAVTLNQTEGVLESCA